MKTALNIFGVLSLALLLGACGKKSSKSSTATTPTNVCTTGYYYNGGVYYNQGGAVCTISTTAPGTNNCANGNYSYNPTTGQYVDNTTGQVCTTFPGTGVGGTGGYGSGCSYWSQIYGVQYYPVNIGNQMVCVRQDLLYGSTYGGGYGVPYYGQQSFYTCQWGYDCNSYGPIGYPGYGSGYGGSGGCVNLGGTSFGSTYGLTGNIGICW